MAFQSVPQTVEIDVMFLANNEVVQNVFYARFGGPYALPNLQAMADAVDVAVAANFLPIMAIETFYQRTEVRGLEFENDIQASANASAGVGSILGGLLPNNVSLAVKKTSGLSGRSARGRTFWIGISRLDLDSVNENFVSVAFGASVEAALEALRLVIDAEFLFSAVLVSRFAGGVKRPFGVTFSWNGVSLVNLIVDTQRGRLPS